MLAFLVLPPFQIVETFQIVKSPQCETILSQTPTIQSSLKVLISSFLSAIFNLFTEGSQIQSYDFAGEPH